MGYLVRPITVEVVKEKVTLPNPVLRQFYFLFHSLQSIHVEQEHIKQIHKESGYYFLNISYKILLKF